MTELQQKTDDVLIRLREIEQASLRNTTNFRTFEQHYRNNIVEKYGWIQLLGANSLRREERKYKLSIAYVALELRKGNIPSKNYEIEDLFTKSRLVWIDGEAGSGKSTLLQWIAVNSAANNGDIMPDLENSIPFLLQLRKFDTRNLAIKSGVNTVMADSDYTMPDNWMTHNLKNGNAIVLLDGFDEVKFEDRDAVLDWIEELARQHPKIRIVVTSRPQVSKNISKQFTRYRLLPMTRRKVDQFLEYWHSAVLVEKHELDKDEADRYIKKLSVQIDSSTSIRKMVTNPLLCAMVCALHYKNGSIISTERNDLYEDCCKMLFGTRDGAKEVQAFSHINLSYEDKKNILSQLAYWMQKNNLVVAETSQVIDRIRHSIAWLRQTSQQYQPEELCQYFLERSGILRSPEDGYIDFIHKSFQEYLAAYEIYNQADWGFIASKADDIDWYETLILSMGFADTHNSKLVIERILDKGNNEKNIVIAAACGTNAPRLVPELRNTINTKIKQILPPQSIDASERLSRAGEFVVPYLHCNDTLNSEEREFCLNTLRLIPSTQSLVAAGTYLSRSAEKKQIDMVGNILGAYTQNEIQSIDFENTIYNFLKSVSESRSLYIPESFLHILRSTPHRQLAPLLKGFSDLTISDYQNRIGSKTMSLFTGLHFLTLVGKYQSISSIARIAKQIVGLRLCDYSGQFDFYELNNYAFLALEKLHLYSNRQLYISGGDCSALKNIKDLGLFLYNDSSELYFDNFRYFSKLSSLSLLHPDASCLDYSILKLNTKLQKLVIRIPRDDYLWSYENIKERIKFVQDVTIEIDNNPFGIDRIY